MARALWGLLALLLVPGCQCLADFPAGLLVDGRKSGDSPLRDAAPQDRPLDAGPAERRDLGPADLSHQPDTANCLNCTCANCTCQGGVCLMSCSGSAECRCPDTTKSCEFQLTSSFTGNVNCNDASSCSVTCRGSSACNDILCKTATLCKVACLEGACDQVKCESSKTCEVTCEGDGACADPIDCSGRCRVTCGQSASPNGVSCAGTCDCAVSCGSYGCRSNTSCLTGCRADGGGGCRACPCSTPCPACP